MKPSALRIERLLAKVEAESRARPRRYCFHFDEVAEAEARVRPRHGGYCERAQPTSPDIPYRRDSAGEHDLHLPAEQIGKRRPATTIGHMNHVDPGHHLEQLARQMCAASDTNRRHVELARIGLAIGDELGNRLGRDDTDTGSPSTVIELLFAAERQIADRHSMHSLIVLWGNWVMRNAQSKLQ
jgi:hypothetical protein